MNVQAQGSGSNADPRLRELKTVGQLHSAAWALFWNNAGTIIAIGLLTLLPPLLLLNYFHPWTWMTDYPKFWQYMAVADVYALMGSLSVPALYYCVLEKLKSGRSPGLRAAFRYAMGKWARVFGYRLLVGFVTLMGALILVVPGVVLALRYSLVIPAAALELDPEVDVVKRSAYLVRGRAWPLLGAALWVYLGGFLLAMIATVVLGVLFGLGCTLFASLPHVAMLDYQWMVLGASYTASGIFMSGLSMLTLAAYLNWRQIMGPPAPAPAAEPAAIAAIPAEAPASSKAVAGKKPMAKRRAPLRRGAVAKTDAKRPSKSQTARPQAARPAAAKAPKKAKRRTGKAIR